MTQSILEVYFFELQLYSWCGFSYSGYIPAGAAEVLEGKTEKKSGYAYYEQNVYSGS